MDRFNTPKTKEERDAIEARYRNVHQPRMRNTIKELATEELRQAILLNPLYRNENEAFGVVFEEYFECQDELERIHGIVNEIFNNMRNGEPMRDNAVRLETTAINLAMEAIQLIAVGGKIKLSEDSRTLEDI